MNGRTVALAAVAMTAVVALAVIGTWHVASASSAATQTSTRPREDHVVVHCCGLGAIDNTELRGTGESVKVDASRYPPSTSFELLITLNELGETDGCMALWDRTLGAVVPGSTVCDMLTGRTSSQKESPPGPGAADIVITSASFELPQAQHTYQVAMQNTSGTLGAARLRARWEEPKVVGGISLDSNLRALPLETSQPSSPSWAAVVGIAGAASLLALGGGAWYAKRRWAR